MTEEVAERLREYAATYNDIKYFEEDPISFPREFVRRMGEGRATLADVEIAAVISSHLAWGRRAMIVRDSNRALDEMGWKPFEYVMNGEYRDEDSSLHRTIKWSDFARLCANLREWYSAHDTLEELSPSGMRTMIFGCREEPSAANKKIHMMRRWMVRCDGKVDFGLWKNTSATDLIIPLDVHVHRQAAELGITSRKSADFRTAKEITDALSEVFPGDPCLGDFALFGYGVTR